MPRWKCSRGRPPAEPLPQQVLLGLLGGREVVFCQHAHRLPVELLRIGGIQIVGAQSGFHMAHRDAQVKAGQCCRTLSTSSLLYAPNSELCRSESTTIRLGLRSALQTPAVQGRFSVVYWYWKQPAAAGTFFEKHSRKLHSFFLFLLYDILVKKSIIEEGVCIMAKILIVDDEPRIRELIREHLQYSGYICEEAADGTAALTQLSGGAFDLVILDLMMPFMDGMTCLREMRARHINTPVIILTARGEEYDKLAGLESGADDYVVKPFSPRELVARVKAVLNRTMPKPAAASDTMTFGELTIDTASHTVRVSGEEVALTPKEFDLLVFLASNKGIALSREKILQKVWNYDYFGEDRTVDTHVKMLRGHLGKCRSYIATVWGIGYKFDPDATR